MFHIHVLNIILYVPHRPNAFQVISQDGHSKITIHCDEYTPGQLNEWVTAINDRIKETVLSEVWHCCTVLYIIT